MWTWTTNYLAKWCLNYAKEQVLQVAVTNPKRFEEVKSKINWKEDEVNQWKAIAEAMYFQLRLKDSFGRS